MKKQLSKINMDPHRRVLCFLVLTLMLVIAGIILIFGIYRKNEQEEIIDNDKILEPSEKFTAEEGIVYYQGEKYRPKDEIMTILLMGIDNQDTFEDAEEMGKAGQSDTNFLAVIDKKEKTVKLIGISRDTMTDIAIYDETGTYLRTVKEHLAIQYAYGDGGKKSCEMMKEAVSNLMYGLPIDGYCAMNLNAIAELNDLVGGVPVTVLQTIQSGNVFLEEGQQVILSGEEAHAYVRYREETYASNDARIQRQKQYLSSFAQIFIEKTKKDVTLPFKLFNQTTEYLFTDISMSQMVYLVTQMAEFQVDLENIDSIEGEIVQPENSVYEEFYVDEKALYEMILEVFYEKDSETIN